MLSNKDIRVENANLIINGVKYPLDTIEIKEEVDALTETVGDETGGLVKDVDDIDERLSVLETIETITGTGSYGSTYIAYKQGRTVQLSIRNVTNETIEQAMILFTLPAGWSPISQVDGIGMYFSGSYDATTLGVVFRIDTNGDVKTYSYREFNNGRIDITYISVE